jgi:hypothetical protein
MKWTKVKLDSGKILDVRYEYWKDKGTNDIPPSSSIEISLVAYADMEYDDVIDRYDRIYKKNLMDAIIECIVDQEEDNG